MGPIAGVVYGRFDRVCVVLDTMDGERGYSENIQVMSPSIAVPNLRLRAVHVFHGHFYMISTHPHSI